MSLGVRTDHVDLKNINSDLEQLLLSATMGAISPPLAPINNLPPELLQTIHLFVYFDHPTKIRTKVSLTLSWVCRRWRDITHSNARLWTEIDFSDPHLALFCFDKSKNALISIALEHHQMYNNWEYEALDRADPVALLRENAYRVSEISLSFTDVLHPSLTSYPLNVLESLLAHKLNSLTIRMQRMPINLNSCSFRANFPSLRSLSFDHYLPISTSSFWDTLQELEDLALLGPWTPLPSVTEYHSILGKLPSLKRLRISTDVPPYTLPVTIHSYPALPLLSLKDCRLELELPILLILLPSMLMQSLERFDLKVSPTLIASPLEQLIDCLQFFTLLENIRVLRISMWTTKNPAEPITECLLEGWQTLKEEPIFKLESKRLISITGILGIFKNIQELYIFGGRYPGGDMGRLHKATTLHLRQTDIRILSEFYLYETIHHLQNLCLHDMMVDGRSDLICNFRHIKRLGLTQCSGVSKDDIAKFKLKGLVVDVSNEHH